MGIRIYFSIFYLLRYNRIQESPPISPLGRTLPLIRIDERGYTFAFTVKKGHFLRRTKISIRYIDG